MTQYGFFFDQSRCTGCHTCAVACKSWNHISSGPVKWLRIYEWESGSFPTPEIHLLFAPCYHCEKPSCVDAADGAMFKEAKYGAVLIDPDKAKSISLKAAWEACPYGSVVFDGDGPEATASKCTMCVDRLEEGLLPICVASCPMRSLDFGPIDELKKKYPNTTTTLEDFPDPTITNPAVVFKPKDQRKQIVKLPVDRVLSLMARRDPLQHVYEAPSDATQAFTMLIGRNKLNMKATNVAELMETTRNDDG